MNKNLSEFETMIDLQENYFESPIDLNLLLESNGLYHKAFDQNRIVLVQSEKA